MKKIVLLIVGIVLVNMLAAQTPLQKADSLFKNKDYYNSITLYNKALKKATGEESKYIYFQLGECYRNGNNYTDAQTWYQKAINAGCTDPAVDLHMGEMLILTGDYTSAKTHIEKYLLAKPDDNIAKIRLEACNLGLKGETAKPVYEVKVQKDLSSTAWDYSVTYFKTNKVIISSTRMEGSGKYDPGTAQGFSDLYESSFNTAKNEWGKPAKLKGSINTNSNEGTFAFDPATNYGYYSQCNGASGKLKQCNIMVAYYNEATNTWENSKLFDFNSETFRNQQACLSTDGKTMYFSSDMPNGYGGADLYKIKKVGDTWGTPENLGPTINTIGNEGFPFISGDTLLVFSSDGLAGFGGLDIFTSTIKNGVFSKPVNMMTPINSSADDFGLVFKDSKNEGFFCSNRSGGIGDDDIYTYDLIPVILSATGNIKDKTSLKNLENATVVFKGSDGSVDSVYTDSKGIYEYTKLKANVKYSLKASKEGYMNDSKNLTVGNELYSKTYSLAKGNDLDFTLIKITKEEVKIDNIYYDYDKADLRDESKTELDKLVNVLKETPDVNLQISAHTDERGAKDYNIELSQKRAQSVVDYLIDKGISADRLIAKGYGFSMPLVKNAKTEDQHQMNRRTTFKILSAAEIEKLGSGITPIKKETVAVTSTTTVSKENNKTTITTVTPTDTTKTVKVTTPASDNKFYIIAGSFPTEEKAKDAVSSLIAIGYTKAEVVGQATTGNWRVAYSGFATKADASIELEKIKKSNTSAWLYEKK